MLETLTSVIFTTLFSLILVVTILDSAYVKLGVILNATTTTFITNTTLTTKDNQYNLYN